MVKQLALAFEKYTADAEDGDEDDEDNSEPSSDRPCHHWGPCHT